MIEIGSLCNIVPNDGLIYRVVNISENGNRGRIIEIRNKEENINLTLRENQITIIVE